MNNYKNWSISWELIIKDAQKPQYKATIRRIEPRVILSTMYEDSSPLIGKGTTLKEYYDESTLTGESKKEVFEHIKNTIDLFVEG